ncbi:MAG: hypothetical protein ACKON7_01465 [Planctomycetaceae bacterium]
MDPHFHEYLAAIAGLSEVYGDHPDDPATEFHAELDAAVVEPAVTAATA